jgi:hypothetical protein
MEVELITYPTGLVGIEIEQSKTSPTIEQVVEALKEFDSEARFHYLKLPNDPRTEYSGLLLAFDIENTRFEVMYSDFPAGVTICVRYGDQEMLKRLYRFLKGAK